MLLGKGLLSFYGRQKPHHYLLFQGLDLKGVVSRACDFSPLNLILK